VEEKKAVGSLMFQVSLLKRLHEEVEGNREQSLPSWSALEPRTKLNVF
jgi:hypothetical protein